jgi:hypothetical protein
MVNKFRNTMRKVIIFLLIVLLFPCKSEAVGLQKTMRKIMKSWIGCDFHTVVNYWGQPQRLKYIGYNIDYYWIIKAKSYVPARISNDIVYGGYYKTLYCVRILSVDSDTNKVYAWNWEGNYCPATEINRLYKAWINPDFLYQEKLYKGHSNKKWKSNSDEYYRTLEATKKFKESLDNQ